MNRATTHQLPRIMPLASVARELLGMDVHDVYRLAKSGRLQGAFKLGDRWFVSVPKLIAAIKSDPSFQGTSNDTAR